jgi:hypothetical protein
VTFFGLKRGPLVIKVSEPATARYVRVISRRPTSLHLDEVEIYGAPPD